MRSNSTQSNNSPCLDGADDGGVSMRSKKKYCEANNLKSPTIEQLSTSSTCK